MANLIDADKVDEIFMAWVNDLITNHGDKAVGQVLGSPAIQAAFTGDVGQSVNDPQMCPLCRIPLATGTCGHILYQGDQVVMSLVAWQRQVAEINGQQDEPDPSAIEVGGVRMEYDKRSDAIHDLASAVRFHGIASASKSSLSQEDIDTIKDMSK